MATYSAGNQLQVLSPGVGYGIIAGIGAVFTAIMLLTTAFQNRYSAFSSRQSEEFNTASRAVKPGLIVAGIVSSWTWSATLLTSSTIAYMFGMAGPFWYAALGSCNILMFSLFSLKVKRDTPGAHTFPEIVLARHGKVAHSIYLANGAITNMFVGACLVLGGAQVLAGLSGVNVYAACFIIPLAVAVYVIQGGLRSTFIADYLHTVILFVAIFIFMFVLYTTDEYVGSIGKMYELLGDIAESTPLVGNAGSSWLTFYTPPGMMLFASIFLASFSLVWLDQAYWQRAIASKPETSVKAYLLGGLAWFGIPYAFGTAMGLGCVALTGSPRFPTYPNPLNAHQIGGGFAAPATAIALLGKNGAVLMLLLLFMAVTSATSAELIAVSSLWTFDVYKLHMDPHASSNRLVKQAHFGIAGYALLLAAFCCGLNASGVDLTWLLTVCGIIIGGGGFPLEFAVLLPKFVSTTAIVVAPLVAAPAGIIVWLVTTHVRSGSISVATSGDGTNAFAGSVTTLGMGLVAAIILSVLFPKKFESSDPEHIFRVQKIEGVIMVNGLDMTMNADGDLEGVETAESKADRPQQSTAETSAAPDDTCPEPEKPTRSDVVEFLTANHIHPLDMKQYHKARRLAIWSCSIYVVVAMAVFPFSLYGSEWVFSRAGWTGWVTVSFIWIFFSSILCIIWPVVESFPELARMTATLYKDLFRKSST